MVIKSLAEVPGEIIEGAGVDGVTRQVLLSPKDGAPNFTMRCFTIEPGGFTFYHTHRYEHEVYVLAGQGVARGKDSETKIVAGNAILVVPDEHHQFINTGNEPLVFLCIIPNE